MSEQSQATWIVGTSLSGKTSRIVEIFVNWVEALSDRPQSFPQPGAERSPTQPGVLVFAAIGEHRLDLADQLAAATHSKVSFTSTTPTGFFQDEVQLFQQLELKAQFPLRLTPETEQELATQLWRAELDRAIAQDARVNEVRLVRRILDLLQLAALAGFGTSDLPHILERGIAGSDAGLPLPFDEIATMLDRWQQWCLERGLLTYSLNAILYSQYLLPHPLYQEQLTRRFQFLLADDVDEYPAIARSLFEQLLDAGVKAAFSFNPEGAVRLGLGADPDYLSGLADRCEVELLTQHPVPSLAIDHAEDILTLATEPTVIEPLPDGFQLIQTTARSQLIRQTATTILEAVQAGEIQPREIAVIGPGLDAIARYAIIDILTSHQIPVESLNDQRPLSSYPLVRGLLTLMALVYPNTGRLLNREAIAEMLVVLTRQPQPTPMPESIPSATTGVIASVSVPSAIDAVRAGLLADYCFAPHPEHPRLLPVSTFPRWDRLGYQASEAYEAIVAWVQNQQEQLEQRLIPSPIALLDRAIQHFLLSGSGLAFDQLSALRQLIETAQHYWEVHNRLRRIDRQETPTAMTVNRFIQLLQSGTITANPFPVRPVGSASNAVTLATVFQYRSSHRAHRWQFWLDVGSNRWLSGVDALYAAPLFLQSWSGHLWTAADTLASNEQRLRRILVDLLARTTERVYLCHSDLATNGQEQTGVLLSLVNAVSTDIPEAL